MKETKNRQTYVRECKEKKKKKLITDEEETTFVERDSLGIRSKLKREEWSRLYKNKFSWQYRVVFPTVFILGS